MAIPRGGLTIHFPNRAQDFDSANYVRTDFHSTNWQSFISAFLGAVGGGGGQGCPTDCNQPAQLQLGQAAQCSFTGTDSLNFYAVNIPATGNYRFQLCGFTYPQTDYDLVVLQTCNDQQASAYSNNYGCEDTTWAVPANQWILVVRRFVGAGNYQIEVSAAAPNVTSQPMLPTQKDQLTGRSEVGLTFPRAKS